MSYDSYNLTLTVLNEFYLFTSGYQWYNNTNWLSLKPFDEWHGLISTNQNIIGINLPNNNLQGSLPSSLNLLTDLQVINLANNYISGEIPSEFFSISSLEDITLSSNHFLNLNLEDFCYFNQLKKFTMSDNYLLGEIPSCFSYLKEMQRLELPSNYLSGSLDNNLANLTNLTYVDLSFNMLSGIIPNTFNNTLQLNTVNLSDNLFHGPFDIYCNWSSLYSLELSYNYFTGTLPDCSLPSNMLRYIVYTNYFSGEIPQLLQLSTISDFEISSNLFTGNLTISSALLRYLVSSNYFTGSIPRYSNETDQFRVNANYFSGTLPSTLYIIRETWMQYNLFTGQLPDDVKFILNNGVFYLQDNLISGSIPLQLWMQCISRSHLPYVRVDNNLLTGTLPDLIGNTSWNTLIMSNNFFSGHFDKILPNIQFVNFDIENNYLSGSLYGSLNWLSYPIQFLSRSLTLNSNYLSGPILSILATNIDKLLYLKIGNNFFTGFLNELFYSSSTNEVLYQLDLGSNLFEGTIPSEVIFLNALSVLLIGNNLLEGTLPSALSDISELRQLDITGLNMCYFTSIARAVLGSSSGTLYRCQDSQDIAMCSLLYQSEIYSTISQSINEVTAVYESDHFYKPDQETYDYVSITDALYYVITFDDWSKLESCQPPDWYCDYILFCDDIRCSNQFGDKYTGTSLPGMNGISPLIIYADSFYIHFSSDSFAEYWGYSLTVSAAIPLKGWNCIEPPELTLPLSSDVLGLYNLSYDYSYAENLCGNDDNNQWNGVTCRNGVVSALSFGSSGISGTLPSIISLLTNIEEIDFSYNSFSGTIPESFKDLVNLNYLDFSNNRLTYHIPSSIGLLTNIEEIYLYSNFISGSLPDSLYLTNKSLSKMLLSGNKLTGKLDSVLCSLSNSTIDISGNNMDCYESCWSNAAESSLLKTDLSLCAPTSFPTSIPTAPTISPTIFHQDLYQVNPIMFFTVPLILSFFLLCACLSFYFIRERKHKLLKKKKFRILKYLPIHRLLYDRTDESLILQELNNNIIQSLYANDYDGYDALQLAIKLNYSNSIIYKLLEYFLPADNYGNPVLISKHKFAWTNIIQMDKYYHVVELVLENHSANIDYLLNAIDEKGRPAFNIASPLNLKVFRSFINFMGRYEILDVSIPHHKSSTSLVYLATDKETGLSVAIKLISSYEHYIREISFRSQYNLNCKSIVEIIDSVDSHNIRFKKEIKRRGWGKFKYCIVMPAADRILDAILSNENISGKEWYIIKPLSWQIACALEHLHSKGIVHGDVKPSNIVRVGDELKLIDLDCSSPIGAIFTTSKVSSGYIPPEFLIKDENTDKISISLFQDSLQVYSSSSIDAWAYGIVLYKLCTGFSLFSCDDNGNIDSDDLEDLYNFSDSFKYSKLKKIQDLEARNLVSRLLSKDPYKRPTMVQVLNHPFHTGKKPARMVGDQPEYDVFISYRVVSDFEHAEKLYESLTNQGFKVWWDKKCLQPGESWEMGITNALLKSRIFVPILSHDGLNFESLHHDSPCDYLLMEFALSLELFKRGLVDKIYPILIGDKRFDHNIKSIIYEDFFVGDTYQKIGKNIIVNSLEKSVLHHLDRFSLGSSLLPDISIYDIINNIMKFQGHKVVGIAEHHYNEICCAVHKIILNF